MEAASVAAVAARASRENFPVASLLFPRHLRPHLRRVYGYCRLVDILGDEAEGDRLALLDQLGREVDACYGGEPTWPVMRALAPTIAEFDLPREPFLRLIEANRMDQRVAEYETWADLKWYCVHSADPCGRLVLGLLRRADEPELVAAAGGCATGSAAGSAARSGSSPGAGSRRSTRSRRPTTTSSRAGRAPRGRGSRGLRWRRSWDDGGAGVRGGRAADPPAGAQLLLRIKVLPRPQRRAAA